MTTGKISAKQEHRLLKRRREGAPRVARRLEELEAEVAAGQRDARSLVAIPRETARDANVIFPIDAFGPPKPW